VWLLCRGLNQHDEDAPRSWQRQKQAVKHCQVHSRAFGPCFGFAKGFYAQPPVSGVLPISLSAVRFSRLAATMSSNIALLSRRVQFWADAQEFLAHFSNSEERPGSEHQVIFICRSDCGMSSF